MLSTKINSYLSNKMKKFTIMISNRFGRWADIFMISIMAIIVLGVIYILGDAFFTLVGDIYTFLDSFIWAFFAGIIAFFTAITLSYIIIYITIVFISFTVAGFMLAISGLEAILRNR